MEQQQPIAFWPDERDEEDLAILEAAGVARDDALRLGLRSLAVAMTPAAAALARTPG